MIPWASFVTTGEEKKMLLDAFDSGWSSGGKYVNKLEQEIETLYHTSRALAVSNGTAALQLSMQLAGVQMGDEVIVPAFCFQAASHVVQQLGAVPVFCDVDPMTWNITAASIETRITKKTKCVVVVHNYGIACDVKPIRALCDVHGILLVEDCAEAWFSKTDQGLVGTLADIATFSMHATKTISSGEGGIVLVKDEYYERAKLLRSHGLDRTTAAYGHKLPGNNYRLSNLLAAVGYGQLMNRAQILQKQRDGAERYIELLGDSEFLSLQYGIENKNNLPWAIAVRLHACNVERARNEILADFKTQGIELRPGFVSANNLSFNQNYEIPCPVSDSLHKDIIVLPCPLHIEPEQIEFVVDHLNRICRPSTKNNKVTRCIYNENITEDMLKSFKLHLKHGRKKFRYFETRTLQNIRKNTFLVMTEHDGNYTGYGHIDNDKSNFWLGICVGDKYIGTKTGHLIMFELIQAARRLNINRLDLRVDNDNVKAISLYEKYGFQKSDSKSNNIHSHYELEIC